MTETSASPGPTRRGGTWARLLPGAVGKWTLEADPGSLRLRDVESGEMLRFAKSG